MVEQARKFVNAFTSKSTPIRPIVVVDSITSSTLEQGQTRSAGPQTEPTREAQAGRAKLRTAQQTSSRGEITTEDQVRGEIQAEPESTEVHTRSSLRKQMS
ncbi:hypothetical protein N7462_000597 [Penicillium macrosclerotiorum]|uniref:uncharacterized protein n=1 Tax=Penicillium macrosclerotiorum TaxID=303699 RepID=UPI0025480703|nr:uncharacterized protein N7462_000597 [Penicillium macrosclerotiorum]KAJ5698592.1 hypothetical protein N7462_000597 [Penicillium macrosclerotiorum]